MQFKTRPDIFVKLQYLRNRLHEESIQIKLVNITGHSGIFGNEMADTCKYAKDMAHKISNGEKSAPAIVSVYDAFRISAEIVTNSWQRHWDNDRTGRYTHDLIPYIDTKVMFPNRREQGSVQGPVLFLVYCADIVAVARRCTWPWNSFLCR